MRLSFALRCLGAALLVVSTLSGCRRGFHEAETQQAAAGLPSKLTPEAEHLWELYVKSATREGAVPLQPGCRPHHFTLPPGVAYKGVAILIHGYTACPQQFFEWASALTSQGYEVLAPIMPGFGREPVRANDPAWPEPVKDVLDELPKVEDAVGDPLDPERSKYALLAQQMNGIAEAARGERIIGGISVGGAVAAHAVNLRPRLYAKAIMFAPFFAVDAFVTRMFVDTLNASRWLDSLDPNVYSLQKLLAMATDNDFLKVYLFLKQSGIGDKVLAMRHSWGAGCYGERQQGRAGICDFLFSNLGAAEIFGLKVLDTLRPVETFVQFVGVEDDKVASTGHIAAAIRKMTGGQPGGRSTAGGEVGACFYRSGANHSLLSRYDAPNENKFWLKDLLRDATDFLVANPAKPFSTNPTTSLLPPHLHCHLSE